MYNEYNMPDYYGDPEPDEYRPEMAATEDDGEQPKEDCTRFMDMWFSTEAAANEHALEIAEDKQFAEYARENYRDFNAFLSEQVDIVIFDELEGLSPAGEHIHKVLKMFAETDPNFYDWLEEENERAYGDTNCVESAKEQGVGHGNKFCMV